MSFSAVELAVLFNGPNQLRFAVGKEPSFPVHQLGQRTKGCAKYREPEIHTFQYGEPEGFMGFEDNRVKFFGHGVGLELDEFPVLADRVDLELAPGMVVAVEPKAFLSGVGPVGIENTYLIGEDGCESLCSSPREIVRIS